MFTDRRSGLVLWAAFLAVVCAGAWAAPAEQAGSAGAAGPVEGSGLLSASPVDLGSPRATVTTFTETMARVRTGKTDAVERALECLELDRVPEATRQSQGLDFANRLYDVLDALVFDLDAIPGEEVSGRTCEVRLGMGEKTVTFGLRAGTDGLWRFGYEGTLKKLDSYLAQLEKESEGEAEAEAQFDPRFSSPRATIRTFVTSVLDYRNSDMRDAIEAFDLSDVVNEGVRAETGRALAVELMMVFNRTKYVRYNEISNDGSLPRYSYYEHPAGSIDLVPLTDEESGVRAWKFSAATVEAIPALYDVLRDAPLVEEVRHEDLPKLASLRARDWVRGTMPFLLKKPLLLANYQWLGLLGIILVGMGVSRLIAFLLILGIRAWFQREKLEVDIRLERDFVRPIRVALMAWVWLLGLSTLGLPAMVLWYLRVVAQTITAGAAVWASYRLIDILGKYLEEKAAKTETRFDDLLIPFLTRGLKIFMVSFGIVFVADALDLPIKSLLAGLGIGGLAFALAAKDTVANLFGSLTILLDRPFQIGDWVTIGDVDGNVETVGMRSTRVRTFYNSLITVPNSELINATIDNMGARRYRRIKCMLSISYDTPPEKIDAFCEGIREIIRIHPYTRKDYFHVYFNEFGLSSLNILLYCFVETPEWATELREKHRLFNDIVRLAHRLKVEFAFPTQTLYMRQDETPVQEGVPRSPYEALVLGRKEAVEIVRSHLQAGAPPPPPVTFNVVAAPEEEEEPRRQGEDDE